MEIGILLTATINPNEMSFTSIKDVNVRKNQYFEALEFYSKFDYKITFVENSDYNLSEMKLKFPKVEFLTFNGNNYSKEIGKGLGEYNCLDFALKNSIQLKLCEHIIKITGRLQILNITKVLKNISDAFIIANLHSNLTFADSRVFIFRPDFLNYLSNFKKHLNDSKEVYFENVLAKAILLSLVNDLKFAKFNVFPRVKGKSGSNGHKYNDSSIHWIKQQTKLYFSDKFNSF